MTYLTEDVVAIAKACYKEFHGHCSGDCGSVKCFFCPGCVISVEERVSNLKLFDAQIQRVAKDYWLLKWRKMACQKMFNNDAEYCISDVRKRPCEKCQYYVSEAEA